MRQRAFSFRSLAAVTVLAIVAMTGCAGLRGSSASSRRGDDSSATASADVPAPQQPQVASPSGDYRTQLTSATSPVSRPNRRINC